MAEQARIGMTLLESYIVEMDNAIILLRYYCARRLLRQYYAIILLRIGVAWQGEAEAKRHHKQAKLQGQ